MSDEINPELLGDNDRCRLKTAATCPLFSGGGFEGDILLPPKSFANRGVGLNGKARRWPNNTIPYDISLITSPSSSLGFTFPSRCSFNLRCCRSKEDRRCNKSTDVRCRHEHSQSSSPESVRLFPTGESNRSGSRQDPVRHGMQRYCKSP